MAEEKITTVQRMFNAYVKGNWQTMNYTREKASHAWSKFWFLLISAGFAFEKTDLTSIRETCSCCTGSGYDPLWYGVNERHYSLAVRCGNLTFAYAYEKLRGRTPFIGIGLDYWQCYPDFSKHGGSKNAGRLVMGTEFSWKGETVKVTNFNDEKHSLIACAYHPAKETRYTPSKVKKRFTITVEDFKQEMTNRRKQKRASFSQLRYIKDTDKIETSRGAFVPAKAAKILYDRMMAGKPVHGFEIGSYTVTGYNGVLKIGCYEVTAEEIERFAKVMNW